MKAKTMERINAEPLSNASFGGDDIYLKTTSTVLPALSSYNQKLVSNFLSEKAWKRSMSSMVGGYVQCACGNVDETIHKSWKEVQMILV